MYQPNIPSLYQELETKNLGQAKKLIFGGTILAAIVYIAAGTFGYAAFAESDPKEIDEWLSNSILAAPYHKKNSTETPVSVYIALFGMMVVVVFATPFCVLPVKDSIEEVSNKKFTPKMNLVWTLVICWITCALSCAF